MRVSTFQSPGGPWLTSKDAHSGGAARGPTRTQGPIVFHVSVAIQQDGAEDPIRELLQVYDTLLPQVPRPHFHEPQRPSPKRPAAAATQPTGRLAQVPRWAEPVLPVLSNLASITDASFSLFAYASTVERPVQYYA